MEATESQLGGKIISHQPDASSHKSEMKLKKQQLFGDYDISDSDEEVQNFS